MARLRSYARLSSQSQKVKDWADAFAAVYAEVDARSEGRCEVTHSMKVAQENSIIGRCPRRAVEHHHLYRPRRSHHTQEEVVHVCRGCHDRSEYPFTRGRLVFIGRLGSAFLFAIRYAASKFRARGQGE